MKMNILLAISALSAAVAMPAVAQDAMMKDGMKPDKMTAMSAADTKKMNACQAMTHDAMMKSATCKKMMKMHPDMVKSDGMEKSDSMKQ